MSKKLMVFSLLFVFVFSMNTLAAEIELGWYQPEPEGHPWTDVGQMICDEVYERSDGRIEIKQYPGGSLGSQPEAVDMLREGSLAFLTSGPAVFHDWYQPVGVFYLPYLFRSSEHAYKAFESDLVQDMFNNKILDQIGVRTIDFWYFGNRTLTLNEPVEKPEDLEGIKVRCMDYPVSRHVVAALGAEPTPISFTELYMALQTGVVEGQENPIPTIYAQKFYEVQDYIIQTNHAVHIGTVHVSEQIWQNDLTEEDRKLILEVFEEHRPLIDERINKQAEEKLEEMKDEGIEVIEPDLEAFKEHANEYIMDTYGDEWGYFIEEIKSIE